MAKILRKSYEIHKGQYPNLVFVLATDQHCVIITFKMLKIDFNFEYTKLTKKE